MPDPIRHASPAPQRAADGGYRLNGEKWFVTTGDVADFLIVLALVNRRVRRRLFLVDKDLPGVSVKRTPRYMHTFVFEHPEFIARGRGVSARTACSARWAPGMTSPRSGSSRSG